MFITCCFMHSNSSFRWALLYRVGCEKMCDSNISVQWRHRNTTLMRSTKKKKINENENDMIIIWKASNKKWYACIKISTKWFQPFERKRTTINNNKRMDHIFICWNEQSIRNRKPEDDYGFETPASVCYFECGQKNTAPGLGGLGWNGIFRSKCILLTLYWNESHRNSRPNSISEQKIHSVDLTGFNLNFLTQSAFHSNHNQNVY